MLTKIVFRDNQYLTEGDAIYSLKHIFGDTAEITVLPDNNSPEAHIYFGIQQLITQDQLEAYYDDPDMYPELEAKILSNISKKLGKIVQQVLQDNIAKCQ